MTCVIRCMFLLYLSLFLRLLLWMFLLIVLLLLVSGLRRLLVAMLLVMTQRRLFLHGSSHSGHRAYVSPILAKVEERAPLGVLQRTEG